MASKKFEGEIVALWQDANNAYIAMAVNELDPHGRMEYNASVALIGRVDNDNRPLPDFANLSSDEQLALLIDTVKVLRTAQRANDIQPIAFNAKAKMVTL